MINISNQDETFLNSYLKDKKFIFTTLMDSEYADMGENWFVNLKNLGHDKNTLIISLDKKCDEYFKEKNIPSIFLESSNVGEEDLITPQERLSIGYDNVYKKISFISHLIKNYNLNVILTHIDIVFLKDPIIKINEMFQENDLVFNSIKKPLIDILKFGSKQANKDNTYIDDTKPFREKLPENFATDFSLFCFKSSDNMKRFTDLMQENKENILSLNDNFSFNNIFIKFLSEANVKISYLSHILFLNGYILQYKRDNCKKSFEKIIENAYSIHYNMAYEGGIDWGDFQGRKKAKIKAMKENNHWFL
jgi:hypothetical protein